MGRTVLVTGSEGFIGSAVVDRLRSFGHQVIATDVVVGRGSTVLDTRDAGSVAALLSRHRPDSLIHLGGVSGPMLHADDPAEVVDVNCVGTATMLAAAHTAGTPNVVYAASVAAYAIGTTSRPRPDSVYAATKRFGEDLVEIYRARGHPGWTSVRIGSVYGRGRVTSNPVMEMIASARADRPVDVDPRAVEPLVHVSDCAGLIAALADVQFPGPVYDLVERVTDHRTIADIVVRESGSNSSVRSAVRTDRPADYPCRFDAADLLADTGRQTMTTLAEGVRQSLEETSDDS